MKLFEFQLKQSATMNRDAKLRQAVESFLHDVARELNLQEPHPHIEFSDDEAAAVRGHHTGKYMPGENSIWVYTKGRLLADIFRTVAHELRHVWQHQNGHLDKIQGTPGAGHPVETDASGFADAMLKKFGKKHGIIYQRGF